MPDPYFCGTGSSVEEDRLAGTLQVHIEAKEAGLARIGFGQERGAAVSRHEGEDRIAAVGRVALKVDAREEPLQEPARKHAHVDVRRLRGPARAGHGTGLDGLEGKGAVLVGRTAAETAKGVGGERPAIRRMG